MNTQSTRFRFSPRIILVILLAAIVIVFSGLFIFRPLFKGNVLESIETNSFRFDLCGNGSLSRIKIYENGKQTATIRTPSVGNAEDHYGVTVRDLTFDGNPDVLVAVKKSGDTTLCSAWVWNPATGTFRRQEAFINVKDPVWNEEYGCIMSNYTQRRMVGEDAEGTYYEEAEIVSIYTAINGSLLEFARYELVYYTRSEINAVLVYRFDESSGKLSTFSEDEWLSNEEAALFVLSEYVKTDMALYKENFPGATQ